MNLKSKLQSFQKKEGSNFLTRDFSDEIYDPAHAIEKSFFISSGNSTMFTDVLVVIPSGKAALFHAEITKMMEEYYKKLDDGERKRFPDYGKLRVAEMKETQDEEAKADFFKAVCLHASEIMKHNQ